MSLADYAESLAPEILRALEQKGFASLTTVQQVVLDPALAGRDLRVTSQTGSGKTVAIGLTLRELPLTEAAAQGGVARPRALVITPTRELAQQVEQELAWLYSELGVRVACTTGGASYRTEQRAFARGPGVVVGTPGRLLDHLRRGAIDPGQVAALVLDEADRMLELGFREDLLAIIDLMPADRATHLVSATFPRALSSLADRVQRDPAHVQGTSLGAANADIDHVIHVVDAAERGAAIINLLLAYPEDQTLVFVRTRADAAELASLLSRSGFAASGLSGEMEQAARNRALQLFREGQLRVLVATDVAARGIDVQGVTRVLHAEPPTDPDAYTHRSGRTGRAGRKGVSALLLAPSRVVQATRLLRTLGVPHRFEPIPTPEEIMQAQDERLFLQLTAAGARDEGAEQDEAEQDSPAEGEDELDARYVALAQRLVEHGSVERVLARLLARTYSSVSPRRVRTFPPMQTRERGRGRDDRSRRGRDDAYDDRRGGARRGRDEAAKSTPREFVPFRVSWGAEDGADARRVLAMVCRRGDIRGTDVGPIRIDQNSTLIGVDSDVAAEFERAASRNDPREPHIRIRRDEGRDARDGRSEGPAQHKKPSYPHAKLNKGKPKPHKHAKPQKHRPTKHAPRRKHPA